MSNIAVLGGDISTIKIGENTSIQKSVIGRNVEIGTKTKISNSIILGNCKIGNDCIIQNSLILNKCTIADKSKISEKEIAHGSDYPQLE
jgi:ADP-glucose pyrophosphorylase